MKKALSLLLALVLCLSLAACASEDESVTLNREALAAADALMEAGDYEAAMEAYYAIPAYAEITEKIDTAYTEILTAKVGPFVGTWKDLVNNVSFTVNEDGTMEIIDETGSVYESQAGYDGETVYVYGFSEITEIDGVPHLKNEYSDYVPAEYYDSLAAKAVEITQENWETYFELRDAKGCFRDEDGVVQSVSIGYGIFLRDEYVGKLKNEWDSISVSFTVQYEPASFKVTGDFPDGEWALGEQFTEPWQDYSVKEQTSEVYSYNYESDGLYTTDLLGHYAADFLVGYASTWEGKTTALVPTNPQILEVSGTLTLFP